MFRRISLFVLVGLLVAASSFVSVSPASAAPAQDCEWYDDWQHVYENYFGGLTLEKGKSIEISAVQDLSQGNCTLGIAHYHEYPLGTDSTVKDQWFTFVLLGDSQQGWASFGPYLGITNYKRAWIGGEVKSDGVIVYFADMAAGEYTSGSILVRWSDGTITINNDEVAPESMKKSQEIDCFDLTLYELVMLTEFPAETESFQLDFVQDMSGGNCDYGYLQIFGNGSKKPQSSDSEWTKQEIFFFWRTPDGEIVVSESIKRDDSYYLYPIRMIPTLNGGNTRTFQMYTLLDDVTTVTVLESGEIAIENTEHVVGMDFAVNQQKENLPGYPSYVDVVLLANLPYKADPISLTDWQCLGEGDCHVAVSFLIADLSEDNNSPDHTSWIFFAVRTDKGFVLKSPAQDKESYIFYGSEVTKTESGYTVKACTLDNKIHTFILTGSAQVDYSVKDSTEECTGSGNYMPQ